jgi:thiamine biosynthesis protein ThiS
MTDSHTHTLTISLNGKTRRVPGGYRLTDLLGDLDLKERLVVVERNGAIVPRGTYSDVLLTEGDVIEIVHFVGGG